MPIVPGDGAFPPRAASIPFPCGKIFRCVDDVLRTGTGHDIRVGGAGNDRFRGDSDFTVLAFHAGPGVGQLDADDFLI